MKILLSVLLAFSQMEQAPDKWECAGDAETPSIGQLAQVKPGELKERVVSCAVPRLPWNVDAQGYVPVQVIVDVEGRVQCARVVQGHPIMRHAALEAAKKWRFKPLEIEGKAQPYVSVLNLLVSWDTEKSGEQCPEEKR